MNMYKYLANTVALFAAVSAVFSSSSASAKDAETKEGKPEVKLEFYRNSTFKLHYAGSTILVDPMLSEKGALPSFVGKENNPTVELPVSTDEVLKDIDAVLVTHLHPDHFDEKAAKLLNKETPVFVQPNDGQYFREYRFRHITEAVKPITWKGIVIKKTEAFNGTAETVKKLEDASGSSKGWHGGGYMISADNHPKIYVIGDSIWTKEVRETIETEQPDYIIANMGGAVVPFSNRDGKTEELQLLMNEKNLKDILESAGSKAKVIVMHLESLEYCKTTREKLKGEAKEIGMSPEQLIIPGDGETLQL